MLSAVAGRFCNTPLYERLSNCSVRLDAAAKAQAPDGLTDLNSNGTIGVRDDPIEFRTPYGSGVKR